MGYLSGSSPHIKSGAVSALSVLVHNNAEICVLVPDLVPSVLALLQTKAVEVIKAVLGFLKVLVLCHQAKDLQNVLPDIVNGVLPWSSVSRHHFREKVTVILEILMRRCGSAPVKLVAPEKYRNFVKSVLENRHGKMSSKETGPTDPELNVLESSPRGRQRKRKHEESSIPPDEDGKVEPRLRNREKKFKKNTVNSNDARPIEGQSRGRGRNERRSFNRNPTASRNTNMKQATVSKKIRAAGHRPGAASKFTNHTKVARKQKKN